MRLPCSLLPIALQLYVKEDSGRSWNKASADSSKLKYDSASVLDVFHEMCGQGRHRQLSDFDDHLNDLSRSVNMLSCADSSYLCILSGLMALLSCMNITMYTCRDWRNQALLS